MVLGRHSEQDRLDPNILLRLLAHTVLEETEPGLLANTYEDIREKLRISLLEIKEKDKQLEESQSRLRSSRDFLQAVIDSIDDELIVLDAEMRIIQANRTVLLKHKDQKVIGGFCYEVEHGLSQPCSSNSCTCPVKIVRETSKPSRAVHIHVTHKEGIVDQRHVEVCASPLFDSSGKVTQIVELIRDITDSKDMENRILEANRHLLALNAISGTVSQSLSLDVILNSTLDKALELFKADIGGILLTDEKTQTLSYKVQRGLSEKFVKGIDFLPLGEGIAGKAAISGETQITEDISRDPRVTRSVVSEEGLKAFISVPLKSKQKVVGVLNISSLEKHSFSPEEIQLLTAIGHQLGIAIENAKLYSELESKEKMRTELLQRIISVQEDERRRVARELHDVTSQSLATLAIRLEALCSTRDSNAIKIQSRIEEMKSLLAATSKEVHSLIYALRPSLLDDLGLPAALRSCAHNALDSAGVEVYLEVVGQEKRLPPQVEIALFRIAQEAITNVARHAQAESIYLSLDFKENSVVLQVEDDGIGFDLSKGIGASTTEEGLGLLGIKERTELLKGTLKIETAPGNGTRISVAIPTKLELEDV
jgi:signal transduction histidine kinase/PAS domain-containing protein